MNGSDDNKKQFGCPYCTREIAATVVECPWCGTGYGTQTMELLRSFVEKGGAPPRKNRRKDDRVPKKFKVAYPTPNALKASYLSNISLGGVYIKTGSPLDKGTRFTLKLYLPDDTKELEIACEVAWAQSEAEAPEPKQHPPGMGIRFLDLSPDGRKRIDTILRQADSKG